LPRRRLVRARRWYTDEGARVITVVPVELADAALAADVVDGLALVEDGLRDAARAQEALLSETSGYLIDAGGKRFRATLVLLAAQFGNPRDEPWRSSSPTSPRSTTTT
jgi:hypothetical protein